MKASQWEAKYYYYYDLYFGAILLWFIVGLFETLYIPYMLTFVVDVYFIFFLYFISCILLCVCVCVGLLVVGSHDAPVYTFIFNQNVFNKNVFNLTALHFCIISVIWMIIIHFYIYYIIYYYSIIIILLLLYFSYNNDGVKI